MLSTGILSDTLGDTWSEILSALVYHLPAPRRLHVCRGAAFLRSVRLSWTGLEAGQGLDQKTAVPALAQSAAEAQAALDR